MVVGMSSSGGLDVAVESEITAEAGVCAGSPKAAKAACERIRSSF